jgi:hypothetical protein
VTSSVQAAWHLVGGVDRVRLPIKNKGARVRLVLAGSGCFPHIKRHPAWPAPSWLTRSTSAIGERHVSACCGFFIDFNDAIEHPVGWRFAGPRGVALDVGDGIAEEQELGVALALG